MMCQLELLDVSSCDFVACLNAEYGYSEIKKKENSKLNGIVSLPIITSDNSRSSLATSVATRSTTI